MNRFSVLHEALARSHSPTCGDVLQHVAAASRRADGDRLMKQETAVYGTLLVIFGGICFQPRQFRD